VAGVQDLTRACTAVGIVSILGTTLVQVFSGGAHPLSLFVIYGIIALILTTGLRASYVILESTKLRKSHQGMPVLIYGAGGHGVAAVRELFQNSTAGLRPIGFIDDDARMRGKLVTGLPVFGAERELESIIHAHGARALVVATEKISAQRLERAAQVCRQAAVSVFRVDVTLERLSDDGQPPEIAEGTVQAPVHEEVAPPIALPTLHLLGCEPCPSCSSRQMFRSKARTAYERLRKVHSPKRIFRCRHCGWRGWAIPLAYATAPFEETPTILDLTSLDGALPQALPSARAASRGGRF
jgi:hypothetical protein